MVKYKLIKEYPGSPKLGSIIQDTNPVNGAKDSWFEENWCKLGKTSFILGKNLHPENYPKFWEEIKENEFLILSVSATKENTLYKVGHVDKITNTKSYTKCILEDSMSLGYWEIHSVQRLSDGEIFKLGDAVARGRDWTGWKNPACIIKSFKVHNKEIKVEIQQKEASSNYSLGGFYHVEIDEDSPKYSKKDVDRVIDRLFDPELISDRSVFGDLLIRNCEKEIFKILDDDKT